MKNIITIIISLFIILFLFSACEKEDKTSPVITLLGDNPMTITLNSTFTDLGATANDDKNGDLTSLITSKGTVNISLKGTYTIIYSVADAAGNSDSKSRTVDVVNESDSREGTYSVVDTISGTGAGIYYYTVTITVSLSTNNKVSVENFGNLTNNCSVNMTFDSESNITIPEQILTGVPAGKEGKTSGSGTTKADGTTLNITYSTDYYSGGTAIGNATYTKI